MIVPVLRNTVRPNKEIAAPETLFMSLSLLGVIQ